MSNQAPDFWQAVPASLLMEPRAYRSSAWSGHVPFAFWIVETLRPRRLVELGTWWGMSYLAFCQAAKAFGTGTKAYAVDTWKGDEHTGPLAERALASLKAEHDPLYADFSTLLRMRFEEAVGRFENGSIDLLHIDGLHTYEAVKNDWDTWFPKLSDRAVVLFHDTQVRDRGFGVYRLWDELTKDYAGVEFHHDHGLGVLAVGADLPPELQRFFADAADRAGAQRIRDVFARFGTAVRATQTAAENDEQWTKLRTNFAVRAVMKAQRMAGLA